MKKITLWLFMLLLFWQAGAQVQVGYGTSSVTTVPISSCYAYSYTQQIYLGSEISSPGTITQLSFYYKVGATNGNANSINWNIYLGNTTKSSYSGNTDWVSNSTLTEVFSGNVVFPDVAGWMTITLDTPFVYDGLSNLAVAVDENTLGSSCTIAFEGFDATNRGIYNRSTNNPSPSALPTASGRSSIIPNIIFGGLAASSLPTCSTVSTPVNAAQNISSSVISWTAAQNSPAGYKLKVGTTSGGSDLFNNLNVGNVLSYYLGTLAPGTTYYVTVTPYNAIGDALACTESTFTTCAMNTTFFENFDNSPTGSSSPFVSCWLKSGNGSVYVSLGSVAPSTSPNYLLLSANGTATTPTAAYATTPPMGNLQAETHRLKFKAYCGSLNQSIDVGYFLDPSDVSSFYLMQSVPLPGISAATIQEFSVIPENIPAYVTNLVFRNAAPAGLTNIYIDDVSWEIIPACGDISAVNALNFNSNAATIVWDEANTETAWQYVYAESSVTDINTLTGSIVNVTTNEINLTNLTPSTSYHIWIRSNCGNGDLGSWPQTPYLFTTTCAPVAEFFENFDSSPIGSSNPLPTCWNRFGNTGYSYINSGSVDPNTPPNKLFFSAVSTTNTTAIAVLPPVSNLQAGTHRIKFRVYSTAANRAIEVGYYSELGNTNSFELLEAINIVATSQATAEEVTYSPAGVPVGVECLVLRNKGASYDGTTTFHIDNVSWEIIPACFDILTSSVEDITATSVSLNWTLGGSEAAWQYVYALNTVLDPSTLTPVDVVNNPIATIDNLDPNTTYNYWIRSNCGNGAFGNWSAVESFVTKCAAAEVFSENFDSYATGSTLPMPNCWERAGNGGVYITTGGVAPGTAPNRLYMTASGSTGTKGYAIMPPVSNLQAGTHRLIYKARSNTSGRTIEIGYIPDMSNLSGFVLLTSEDLPGSSLGTFIYQPAATDIPEGIKSLVFRNVGITTGSGVAYIDDVSWELAPACPTITNVTVGALTDTTASLTWTAADSETTWEYVYGLATVSDPTTLTPISVSGTPSVIISDLSPITSYNFWVRAICGTTVGAWSNATAFTTACGSYSPPFSENFNVFLPACWATSSAGTIATGPTAPSGGFWLEDGFLNNGATGAARVSMSGVNRTSWLITPQFELEAGEQYSFKFNYGITSTLGTDPLPMGTDDTIQVAISDDLGVTWNEVTLFDATSGITNLSQDYIHTFTSTSTNAKFAIIAKNGTVEDLNNYSFYVDNIAVEVALGTSDFEAKNVIAYPNPVKSTLNLNYNQTISKVSVYNLLGQEVLTTRFDASQGQVNMAQLASGTYLVKVMTEENVHTIKVIKE